MSTFCMCCYMSKSCQTLEQLPSTLVHSQKSQRSSGNQEPMLTTKYHTPKSSGKNKITKHKAFLVHSTLLHLVLLGGSKISPSAVMPGPSAGAMGLCAAEPSPSGAELHPSTVELRQMHLISKASKKSGSAPEPCCIGPKPCDQAPLEKQNPVASDWR